jgi:hypothetical protein
MVLAKTVGWDGELADVLWAVKKMEEVGPPAAVPFWEALECTKVTRGSVRLSGGRVAYAYCAREDMLEIMSRILAASLKRPITIYLSYQKESERAMVRTERRALKERREA